MIIRVACSVGRSKCKVLTVSLYLGIRVVVLVQILNMFYSSPRAGLRVRSNTSKLLVIDTWEFLSSNTYYSLDENVVELLYRACTRVVPPTRRSLLPFVCRCINESMRLWPVAAQGSVREPANDVPVDPTDPDGAIIPKGSVCLLQVRCGPLWSVVVRYDPLCALASVISMTWCRRPSPTTADHHHLLAA